MIRIGRSTRRGTRKSAKLKRSIGKNGSTLEQAFDLLWKAIGGPPLVKELAFAAPARKWRFDFAHPPSKTAFEIEGGVWSRGRHLRPGGFIKDCYKYNHAQMMGWKVFRLTKDMINSAYVGEIKSKLFGNETYR